MIVEGLNKTQQKIYELIVEKATPTKDMASILNKSPRTISTNIEMILDFFGVENQKELIIMHYRKLMNK